MTDNPPPPSEERPSSDSQFDPRRPSIFPPSAPRATEPMGCAGRVALALLGFVSFFIALGVFATVLATGKPAIGLGVAVAVLVGMFVLRKKVGPSPAFGAAMVGVGIAVVVFGGCLLILMNTKMDFR
jgi:drug/metabolite transporter (DMT)-like permease